MHCPGGNATDPIWRVLAFSGGISSWTPLKPQHSNPNPLANKLWCIDFLTPPTPLIIPHRLLAFIESFMPLKNWCSIHTRCSKSSLRHSICFCGIFPSLKQNFIAYRSSKVLDCIFKIHHLWWSGFSRVYSNCYCSCSFEPETIKVGQSSHNMDSNNILNFQESTTILNTHTKKSGNLSYAPCMYKKDLELNTLQKLICQLIRILNNFEIILKNEFFSMWLYQNSLAIVCIQMCHHVVNISLDNIR